jgi:hypothetical protein
MTKRPGLDPACIFVVSLVLSVVLWSPTVGGTLNGKIDITDAGIRYFCALAISWAGVFGISAIVALHARRPRRSTPPPAEHPARRHDDVRRAANDQRASNAA